MRKCIFGVFIGLGIWSILISAVEAGSLSGRLGLNYNYATTDNDTASLVIPGSEPEFRLSLLGRYNNFDMTFNSNFHYNEWDEAEFDLFALGLNGQQWKADVGDFFIVDNSLTVHNRLFRGGRLRVALDGETVSTSRLLFDVMAGEINKPREEGDKLEGLYNQKAIISQYRRFQWMAKATAQPTSAVELNAAYAGGQDQESSIAEEKRDRAPLENHVFQADMTTRLLDENLVLKAEFARSQTDSVTDNSEAFSDETYRIRGDWRLNNFRAWARWQHIGADFFSTGYPYLPRDREGPLGGMSYLFPNLIFFSAEYEQYDNNLDDDDLLTVTTKVVNSRFRYLKSGLPNVSVLLRYQDESSPAFNDSLQTDRQITRLSLDVSHSIGRALRASASFIMQSVENNSLPDTATVQVDSDERTMSFNLHIRPTSVFSISPGLVYNHFDFPELNQTQEIMVGYAISEVHIIPSVLRVESDIRYTDSETSTAAQSYTRLSSTSRLRWYYSRMLSLAALWKFDQHDVEQGDDRDFTAHKVGLEVTRVF